MGRLVLLKIVLINVLQREDFSLVPLLGVIKDLNNDLKVQCAETGIFCDIHTPLLPLLSLNMWWPLKKKKLLGCMISLHRTSLTYHIKSASAYLLTVGHTAVFFFFNNFFFFFCRSILLFINTTLTSQTLRKHTASCPEYLRNY